MVSARILLAALFFAFAGSACCTSHPKNARPTQPDHQCRTGTAHGFDVAVWNCLEGQRVVAWRTSAEGGCSDVTVEQAACGTPTAFERGLDEDERKDCAGTVIVPQP